MEDKILGILGGMGPEATIDLFSKIVAKTNAKCDKDHIRIIIDNNPKMPSRQDAILKGTENPGPYMADTAKNLEKAGADFLIIGANTAHYFYDDVKNAVNIPVLHIIEEAVKETMTLIPNINKVGILATTAAMQTNLYKNAFNKFGIEAIEVDEKIQKKIHDSIFSFKYNGLTEANLNLMLEGVQYLIDNGAEALILGCTEIPIILKGKYFSVPLIDPNEVIAGVAVKFAKNQL